MKPYQLDRMLLHLKQAGKFKGVRGIVLGEFPESEPPEGSYGDRQRCLPAHSGSAAHSHRLRRSGGPHAAPDADDAAGRSRAASCVGRRATRNSRTGGARMTRPLHFHLSGIGGAAMAPLAGMLAESGHRVTGSDAGVYPPASTLLEGLGIRWTNGFSRSES